jgi:hypothetical protein
MSWVTGIRGALTGTTAAAAFVGAAALGATVAANPTPPPTVQADPGCDAFGWRHPLCGGGAWAPVADDGIPGDNAAEGGIPAPPLVPNTNGTMSLPGTPGAI